MRWPALCLFVGVGLIAASPCSDAGWVIIKNETQQAVLVVEIAGTPNKPIQGKPVKLQPGETYREFHAAAGQKTFAVYDAAKPAAALGQQSLSWGKDDAAFAIRPDGGAAVKVASAEKK